LYLKIDSNKPKLINIKKEEKKKDWELEERKVLSTRLNQKGRGKDAEKDDQKFKHIEREDEKDKKSKKPYLGISISSK